MRIFLTFSDPLSLSHRLPYVNDYLQEVQQGQKDLEAPLHHGDQQDQKGRGYQQAQVHPENGNNGAGN